MTNINQTLKTRLSLVQSLTAAIGRVFSAAHDADLNSSSLRVIRARGLAQMFSASSSHGISGMGANVTLCAVAAVEQGVMFEGKGYRVKSGVQLPLEGDSDKLMGQVMRRYDALILGDESLEPVKDENGNLVLFTVQDKIFSFGEKVNKKTETVSLTSRKGIKKSDGGVTLEIYTPEAFELMEERKALDKAEIKRLERESAVSVVRAEFMLTLPESAQSILEPVTGKYDWATKDLLENEANICLSTGEFKVLPSILELDDISDGLPYSQCANGLFVMANGTTLEDGLSAYKLENAHDWADVAPKLQAAD